MNKHVFVGVIILVFLSIALFTNNLSAIFFGLGAGVMGGLTTEYTGVRILRLWSYGGGFPVRILIRGWGEIGVIASLAAVLLPNLGIAFLIGFLFPLLMFEVPNLRHKGWKYYTPTWLVVLGWGLAILVLQLFVLGMKILIVGHTF